MAVCLLQPTRRDVRDVYVEAACCPRRGRVADVQEHVRGAASYGVGEHASRYLGDEFPWRVCGAATVNGGSRIFAGRVRAGRFLVLFLEGPGVQNL